MNNQLLVSTILNLIHIDGNEYNIIHTGKLEEGSAHYTGITWDTDQIYVAACENFNYKILVFDKAFNVKWYIDNCDLYDTHQIIMKWPYLYCTNTGKNRIDILDMYAMWSTISFYPSSGDIDHPNSIWFDDKHFYIVEYRHRDNQPDRQQSVIRICDLNLDLIETIEIGDPIHNAYVENGKLYSVTSNIAGIYELDLFTKKKITIQIAELQDCFVRGLARTKSNWFIGACRWERDRKQRHVGDGVVIVLDNDFKIVKKILMPDVGPVYDIRIINKMDLAHNGVEF
jgi:DNA-binding beta-propeller fold protein YncE